MKRINLLAITITLLFLVSCSGTTIENEISLGHEYSTDGKYVYYIPTLACPINEDCAPRIKIKGADPDTFEIIGNGYSKDKDDVFLYEKKIKGIDAETFEHLGRYVKDKNFVYQLRTMEEKLEGVDAETFEVIDESYTKDKNNVYYREEKIEGISPEGFEFLDNKRHKFFVKDKNSIYYFNGKIAKEVKNADSATFEGIGEGYAKDKDSIYYHEKKIIRADLETFEVIDVFFAKDKNNKYFEERIMQEIPS